MKVYHTGDFETEEKSDHSPLTKADKRSHEIIYQTLKKEFHDIPIVSEEGKTIPFEMRKT